MGSDSDMLATTDIGTSDDKKLDILADSKLIVLRLIEELQKPPVPFKFAVLLK